MLRWLLPLMVYLPLAVGHYQLPILSVNGIFSKVWQYVRRPPRWPADRSQDLSFNLEPLWDSWSTDIRCGEKADTAAPETETAKVKAGDELGFHLFEDKTIFHYGPTTVWLSKAPGDVATYDGSGDWFKIYEDGMTLKRDAKYQYLRADWPSYMVDKIMFKLPLTTPPGQYLLRIEHDQVEPRFNATQRFVNCAQIDVSGEGGGTPGPLVKIPNPSMLFDRGFWISSSFYGPGQDFDSLILDYKPPFGPVWTG